MESANGLAAETPVAVESASRKRSTDCVYFLASPNTCNKGSECEYRHSEGARMNPRDCWFWLNGNCLNPKCSFRHPPLDGLYGPAAPVMHSVPIPAYAPTYNPTKKPCHFFQRGNCLNGDMCPYMHAIPGAGSNNIEQGPKVSTLPTVQAVESAAQKTSLQGAPLSLPEKPEGRDARSTVSSGVTLVMPAESLSGHEAASAQRHKVTTIIQPDKVPSPVEENQPDFHRNSFHTDNGLEQDCDQNEQATDGLQENSRDGDEFILESSPGFDVLVDSIGDEPLYLHNEEEFGGVGRKMYPVDDFEYGHVDYDVVAHHEREQYRELAEPDRLRPPYEIYDRKRRRASSERNMDSPMLPDGRYLSREPEFAEMTRSDLRHRLSKHRRRNSSRSTVSPDAGADWNMRDERYLDEQRINGSRTAVSPVHLGDWYRRDGRYMEERPGNHRGPKVHDFENSRNNFVGSRLQGRINIPEPSGAPDMHGEQERDRRRFYGKRSPGRSSDFHSRYQGRFRNRSGDVAPSVRFLSSQVEKDADPEFNGPKRISRPNMASDGLRLGKAAKVNSGASLDFEGPKPLSEILRMKREALSSNGDTFKKEKCDDGTARNGELTTSLSFEKQPSAREGSASISEETEKKGVLVDTEEGYSRKYVSTEDAEDDVNVDVVEDYQEFDARDGYFGYEDGDKNGGSAVQEDGDEYDDDDEDDFAQKVGIMFSKT